MESDDNFQISFFALSPTKAVKSYFKKGVKSSLINIKATGGC